MIIEKAEIVLSYMNSNKKKVGGGLYIDFKSKDNVNVGDYFLIIFEDREHYFEVSTVSVNEENLLITAKEIGYWVYLFNKNPNFDLRKLIGIELFKITDKDKINKINTESCYC